MSDSLTSPAMLLQARNLRNDLHFLPNQLQSKTVSTREVVRRLESRVAAAAQYKSSVAGKRGSSLKVGQRVRTFISTTWKPGVIEQVCTEPDSYVVQLDDGRKFRRTRRAINVDSCLQEYQNNKTATQQAKASTLFAVGKRFALPNLSIEEQQTPRNMQRQPDQPRHENRTQHPVVQPPSPQATTPQATGTSPHRPQTIQQPARSEQPSPAECQGTDRPAAARSPQSQTQARGVTRSVRQYWKK